MSTPRQRRLLLLALDPVHVGTGGFRLGRVDLSIAREPGTKLPKIPGTTLSGVARAYAAYQFTQGKCPDHNGNQCGKPNCPVCYTFGHVRLAQDGTEAASVAGTVNLFDAQILFFPVWSAAGPLWVTSHNRLADAGFTSSVAPTDPDAIPHADLDTTPHADLTFPWDDSTISLGWLLLPARAGASVSPPTPVSPLAAVTDRLALVSDKLFARLVNDNLEVRTSVRIDPRTRAALSGALFTYEAIPRATWLYADLVEDDFRGGIPNPTNAPNTSPLDVALAGLYLAKLLGVGGMGTRGFGRLRTEAVWEYKV